MSYTFTYKGITRELSVYEVGSGVKIAYLDSFCDLELRAAAEAGACEGKLMIAKKAKQLGYDAIHDTVHEMAKDEARHGAGFAGLLKRYFGK